MESRGIHESGTQGEMVTYRYYVGRLNMFEDQYDLAEKNFDYALRHCHRSAVANKKRILNYLVPVKLLRGRLPTSKCKFYGLLFEYCCIVLLIVPVALTTIPLLYMSSSVTLVLHKYSLHEFVPLSNGMRTGNLMEFSDGLMKSQDLFIR